VTSPLGAGGFKSPPSLKIPNKDKDNDFTGYSSSESVSSVGSQDYPIVRKKRKDKRDTHGAATLGGLDDVLEETSSGFISVTDTDDTKHRFGAPVTDIKEDLVEYICRTSGDIGQMHTLSSTWIPTGLFPQSSMIRFRQPIYISKVIVECSGVRRMKLIVGVDSRRRVHASPIMPETVLVATAARHTDLPSVDILDTPRKNAGKKIWSAGHLGHGHSPR